VELDNSKQKTRILAVDDDPFTLETVRLVLKRRDLEVAVASTAEDAMNILSEQGTDAFDAVITDFRMPGMSGLDLLSWISNYDTTLGTIILTGEGEREVVMSSFRRGACDFLEKPFKPGDLRNAIAHAMKVTQDRRNTEETFSELEAIGVLQKKLTGGSSTVESGRSRQMGDFIVSTAVFPIRESGGDFYKFYPLGPRRIMFVCGDVSGHDLKAGFISAYFQGIVHGMVEMGGHVQRICEFFNRLLVQDWNQESLQNGVMVSLSCGFVVLDLDKGYAQGFCHGAPLPGLWSMEHGVQTVGSSGSPLGWMEPLLDYSGRMRISERGCCVVWTDGLEDLAKDLHLNPYALAYVLSYPSDERPIRRLLSRRHDDVMVLHVQWGKRVDDPSLPDLSVPIFRDRYSGDTGNRIDFYQADWEKNIQAVLPLLPLNKLQEIILCIREAILNGLEHGCGGQGQLACRITMALDEGASLFYIRVDDDGRGFQQEPLVDIESTTPWEHVSLGTAIIKCYAQKVEYFDSGSTLLMTFRVGEIKEANSTTTPT